MAGVTADDVAELKAKLAAQDKEIAAMKKPRRVDGGVPDGAPTVTKGAIGDDSRSFSLCRALWACRTGDWSKAKAERDICEKYHKALMDTNDLPQSGTWQIPGSFYVPLGHEFVSASMKETPDYKVFKAMFTPKSGVDLDEIRWMASHGSSDVVKKAAQSYLIDNIGGTLVAPPVQGELIELIRPREALLNAGATSVPLPANGRIVYPRQTSPTTAYWVGENTEITESQAGTGQVAMQAKKLGVLVTVPNELLMYASVAAEAMIRTDSAKSLALGLDYAGLYGAGSAAQPKGLIYYNGTNQVINYSSVTPAPKGIGANGNSLQPQDAARMIGLVEDRNFEFSGWIFRPTLANNITAYRADAVAVNDAAGAFVASMMRALGDREPLNQWAGYKVTKSAVIRNDQTKGNATNLTEVFGGQWEHLLVGMYGSVEFAVSNQAGNSFKQDQTQIRSLLHADVVPRYEGAFIYYPTLIQSVNN